ncbi:hypothetical protein [Gloeothece verrucosa]|uniref:Uncharacterized protein n=1 Tax=Gloeothece verrucosa (strain PCC 7822) TaxID=497965 RepID=E0U9G8_GLOV7|nr:hypothetical protein [Gloeothece verrucosa]ADN12660.1 hypothetical protein Cyan7822_0624 [Gloeothece verrucosa PCC 7822]
MDYKISIQKHEQEANAPIPTPVDLHLIGSNIDVTKPTFSNFEKDSLGNGNNLRLTDAKNLFRACASHINKTDKPKVPPKLFFIYRAVAIGGLTRGLGQFASKPLTVKDKSIDPNLISNNDDFRRLTGLVPIQKKLAKPAQGKYLNGFIELVDGWSQYKIVKKETTGNSKSYLCCDKGDRVRGLSWEDTEDFKELSNKGKILCTFLGNNSAPYLADWDLVLVGVSKPKPGSMQKSIYRVVDQPMNKSDHNILPQWLYDCLEKQSGTLSSHVTQHGPESLYCGNDITEPNEEFLVLRNHAKNIEEVHHYVINNNSAKYTGKTSWDKLQTYLKQELTPEDYFYYQFDEFTGKENKPGDYRTAITKLNDKLPNT